MMKLTVLKIIYKQTKDCYEYVKNETYDNWSLRGQLIVNLNVLL